MGYIFRAVRVLFQDGRRAGLLAALALAFLSGPAVVAQDASGFRTYLDSVAKKAEAQGVSRATIDGVMPSLGYDEQIAALDRRFAPTPADQPIPPFAPYKARHVDAPKIAQGRRVLSDHAADLRRIEAETGVPASVMIAIFGHETNYGTITGNTDLARALATLAYEGRRRALFEGELIATLKLIDRGVPRSVLKGSFAGAFGYPQFLPSVYLRLAKDGDGDGRAEIWSSRPDAFASIANYFVDAGWQKGVPWGFAVEVPGTLNRGAIANTAAPQKCPRVFQRHSQWKTLAEWKKLGIVPLSGQWPDERIEASLLEPDGAGQTAYLLTRNYRAFLDYNCSNFYALSVGLLADEVGR